MIDRSISLPNVQSVVNQQLTPTPIQIAINRTIPGKLESGDPRWETHTTTFETEHLDPAGIAQAICAGWSLAAVHHKRRHSDHFVLAQHLGLDFDEETPQSSLDYLCAHSFVKTYAALAHTTSSHKPDAPRSRVLFILDRPILDAHQYASYASALVWLFNGSDTKCKDAARLFFGAVGCETRQIGKVLPVVILEIIRQAHRDALRAEKDANERQYEESRQGALRDTEGILNEAIKRATPGARNDTGFWLACRLRDLHVTAEDAHPILRTFQMSVENAGDHPYTPDEANHSLRSAYSRSPRRQTDPATQRQIDLFEWWAWYGRLGNKQGDIHPSVKLIMGICDIMADTGSTQQISLPVRRFWAVCGIKKDAARRYLIALRDAGVLILERKSRQRRATLYSLNVDMLDAMSKETQPDAYHTGSESFTVAQSAWFKELQTMPHFQPRAKIDLRLWPSGWGEVPQEILGPAAQRMIAVLAHVAEEADKAQILASEGRCRSETDASRGRGTYCVSVSLLHLPLNSLKQWYSLSSVSKRKGVHLFRTLQRLGIVSWEWGDTVNAKVPYLTDDWYERLQEIAPALTTFGHDALITDQYERQRSAHHRFMGRKAPQSTRDYHEGLTDQAKERRADNNAYLAGLREQRKAWCIRHGIEYVPIQLQGQPKRDPKPKRTRVNGRDLGPTQGVKPNRNMVHEELYTPQDHGRLKQEFFDLLERPALMEKDTARLRNLSGVLGLDMPQIERIELNRPP